jgi:hypothetical protein
MADIASVLSAIFTARYRHPCGTSGVRKSTHRGDVISAAISATITTSFGTKMLFLTLLLLLKAIFSHLLNVNFPLTRSILGMKNSPQNVTKSLSCDMVIRGDFVAWQFVGGERSIELRERFTRHQ